MNRSACSVWIQWPAGGNTWSWVDAAFTAARAFVVDYAPTLVVSFAPDHHNGFFYDLMPPFCFGYEALGVGDYGSTQGPLSGAQRCRRPARSVGRRP